MKPTVPTVAARLDNAALLRLLSSPEARRALGGDVVAVRRAPGAYHSSFAIEDVEVTFGEGRTRGLVLKDVSPGGLLADAARAKPSFLYDPRREIETYRHVLGPHALGAPALVAAAADDAGRWYVLVLEKVAGVPLWQVGEIEAWAAAARWAATAHRRLAAAAPSLAAPARLLRYDADYYAHWAARARGVAPRLAAAYDRVIPMLLDMPRTFIHGEFHASNILVETVDGRMRIRPVDWEIAALGPGLMDLADLTAGNWADDQRDAMAAAYRAETESADTGDFEHDLDCCRLHRAVQWAFWADDWSPPPEHDQDWLAEARRVAERLGVA